MLEAKSAALSLPVLQGPVTVAASQKVGRVVDMSWAPLPQPVGAGSVLALALDDGSLAFVDASQTLEQSTRRQRLQAFKHLIGGAWPYPQVRRCSCLTLGGTWLCPCVSQQQLLVLGWIDKLTACKASPGLLLDLSCCCCLNISRLDVGCI